MEHKTKVIAVRVTQTEYDALVIQSAGARKVSQLVYDCLGGAIESGMTKLIQQRKASERKAKRDAKKAAANGVQ